MPKAAMAYPTYAQQQGAVMSEGEKTKQETAKAPGQAVAARPGVAQVVGLAHVLKDAGGSHTGPGQQTVNPTTNPLVIEEQPPPLVVGSE